MPLRPSVHLRVTLPLICLGNMVKITNYKKNKIDRFFCAGLLNAVTALCVPYHCLARRSVVKIYYRSLLLRGSSSAVTALCAPNDTSAVFRKTKYGQNLRHIISFARSCLRLIFELLRTNQSRQMRFRLNKNFKISN